MSSRVHRKQILLFLLAVILPSLVLVVFTLRMISQERELAQKRMVEERRRLAREIGQHLLVRLEKIKLQESSAAANWSKSSTQSSYLNPEVVLIGQVLERQFLLPWDANQKIKECARFLTSPDFSGRIQQAEKEEFAKKNFLRAAELYRQSMNTAQEPVQKSYARLLLARVLTKSGRKNEALAHYHHILVLPSSLSDEYGIPMSLYAAGCLLETGEEYGKVVERLRSELGTKRWLSPTESYMLQELAEKLIKTASEVSIKDSARDCQRMILEYIQKMEQALALKEDFQSLALIPRQRDQEQKSEPLWVPYGDAPWLVSLAPALGESLSLIIVVKAKEILASLKLGDTSLVTITGEIRLYTGISSEGESLGPNFRGLRIDFTTGKDGAIASQWNLRRSFYILALLLILSVTLFGSYLLWRDVRRDVRLAELRSQFVSSVSHELKTPLTAIRMFAETLRLGRSRNKKMKEEYLDTIVNESERLTRLLNNVLDFSKMEEGRRIYHPRLASLSEIVHAAARAMKYPLSKQGFKLHVDVQGDLPEVRIDRDTLEQAILNLLNNAMKYSGDSRDIDLRLLRKDGYALIQVIDRGTGIDQKEQKKIFEKFYRIPTPENERMTGTGLGLALVSHIVKAHGGNIEVKSAPGKGSTFSIYLPLENKE
jgi:signal transduction histidine kinase